MPWYSFFVLVFCFFFTMMWVNTLVGHIAKAIHRINSKDSEIRSEILVDMMFVPTSWALFLWTIYG